MQLYSDVALDGAGNTQVGIEVTVKNSAGSTATIYDANGASQSNPITTDSDGGFSFRALNGDYTFWVSGSQVGQATLFSLDYPASATATAGSVMRIDYLLEDSTYPLEDEAAIWSNKTYSFLGVNKEFTAGHGSLTGGPVAALFAFANNNNNTADVVAIIGDAVARTANDVVFGANFIARNASVNGTKLVGLEVDVEPAVGTTIDAASGGIFVNIFSIATSAPVLQAGAVGSGTWGNGILTSHITGAHHAVVSGDSTTAASFIDARNGTFSNAAVVLGSGAAHGINFGGGAFGTDPFVYASGNDLRMNMGSSGYIVMQAPGGASQFTFDQYGAGLGAAWRASADVSCYTATGIPAGGTTGAGFKFSSTANFGVFFGSGAPSLTAAKGSLYLRSDGSSTSTRAYINTDGGTTWTAITTAA